MKQTDVVVVGAGPAGMTCAIYLKRAGKNVVVFEGNTFGGQIVNTPDVANYPGFTEVSGFDLANSMFEQATALGAEFNFDSAEKIEKTDDGFVVKGELGDVFCRAVILAVGANNRRLGIANEERLTGHGVSYCATCDGAFFKGREVAVNGGGNTAVEDAIYLSGICSKVYLIHRREGFRADDSTLALARSKTNIEFLTPYTVKEIEGDSAIESLVLENKNDGTEKELKVAGLFVAIGQVPATDKFEGLVNLTGGYVDAGEDCVTETPGVFVAGDCRTKEIRQLTTATGDGACAATACARYLDSL